MLRIDFVTLFPEMVLPGLRHSILARAEAAGHIALHATNPRDFATDAHRTVDGRVFGGGPGMVLLPEIMEAALTTIGVQPAGFDPATVVAFPDPTGELFADRHAVEWARAERVVFVCGHYEGIDERVFDHYGTHRVSLGDFVLTGGELPAMVMADAVARKIPGVLGDPESLDADSFSDGLLGYPQYTKPRSWNDREVPEVLLSGNHEAIARWRRSESLRITKSRRPDLFSRAPLKKEDLDWL